MALLLLLGTIVNNCRTQKFGAIHANERRIGGDHLFIHDEVLPERPAQASVLLRPMRRQPALRTDLLREAFGELNILIGLFVQPQCLVTTLWQFRLQETAALLAEFF